MRKWFVLLAAPVAAYAQDSVELQEVIVSDSRLETSVMEAGRNVQVLTREQITQLPVTSVNELLQHVSGVDFRQRGAWGAQADVSLRGGTFDQCLVLVNGMKVNDPQTGHHTMNLGIDLEAIRQVEIIKGPAAARYGLNSFSGVINIVTAPAGDDEVRAGLAAGQAEESGLPGTFYGGYRARASVNVAGERMKHYVSGSRTLSTGYRPHTDFGRHALNYQSVLPTKWGEFNLMGSYVNNAFGASGFYAFPIDSTSEERVETYLAGVQHTWQRGAFRLHTRGYLRKNFDTYTLFREAPQVYQNRHRTDVGGAELHATYSYSIGTVGLGIEYRQEAITSNNLGQWTRNNYGHFAENRLWLFDQRLVVNTGFYLNHSVAFGMQFLPSADLNYKLTEQWNAFASWGQSFRVPTFTDLYYTGPTNLGNPDLQPERSNNYETGLKWKSGPHYVQTSVFYQEFSDLIDWVRDSVSQPWQPRNHEAVTSTGIDFNYELRAAKRLNGWLTWNLARLNYTRLDMEIRTSGERLSRYALNNLAHQVVAQLAFTAIDRIGLTLTGRYLDRTSYKSYWLIDARMQYLGEGFTLWADATNLLDTDYIEAANAPMPGRWYRLGVDLVLR